ncbi:MAG: hypothetical protein A2527_12225 [Candidatus Lambdaproteobacteria bacterium RIFOXYD2_FULL_50_16]|uniref:ABC3 transporter permease C-terminal domain-containing protein n=1 Tax=Candidatus Lambdaproteobacteria bacterium RIFOXYD2_FULL_50_16 TaxID=1817772 RepID=A0A1F6GD92_9PROT|nr:MAG: hypothetical protein A2527_12225 [Candidatus Lambdaproteobacteria bacterium RIFOXYD2_FULL_50_16]
MWFRLAFKELINHRGFSLFFLANLTIGLVGFIALDSFKLSLKNHIENKSKAILAADLSVYAARPFTLEEETLIDGQMPKGTVLTKEINFMSMIRGPKGAKLVEIVAVDQGYPLYGEMTLDGMRKVGPKEVAQELLNGQTAWIQPELVPLLGLEKGGQVAIGQSEFAVGDLLLEAPGQNFWNAGIAYKVFIGYNQAIKTGLIGEGSRRYHHRLYKLPPDQEAKEVAERLQKVLVEKYGPSPYLYLRTHAQANQQMSRVLGYLNDYLGLVALVALFLAGMGTAFLFRNFLSQRIKELAILRALGASPLDTLRLSLWQIAILGAVAAVLASSLAQLGLPLLAKMMVLFLPLGFQTQLSYQSMILALAVGIGGSTLFCLPMLWGLKGLNPKILLQETYSVREQSGLEAWIWHLPVLLLYWGLSVWQANSIEVGSLFMASLVSSAVILAVLGLLPLKLGRAGLESFGLRLRLALRNLGRGGASLVTSVMAIGIGALLINLIPQIHKGLSTEISAPESGKLPSFFLFDIQPEQRTPLKVFIEAEGYQMGQLSAMVLARLLEVGDHSLTPQKEEAQTREQENAQWAKRRDQNLSYRFELYASEALTAGVWFKGAFDPNSGKLPEISLEERFATRIGVVLGDKLSFDVQGVPLAGEVTSLRRVKWNSFEPNFFILFQPGVLEDAPATFLATIPRVPEDQKVGLQNRLADHFSNVSLINVSGLIKKVLEVAEQVRWAIQAMALLAVIAGLVVVYSIASFNAQSREKEINLLKILGASFADLRISLLIEFGLIGFFSSLAGVILSLGIAWGLAQLIFERIFELDWNVSLLTIGLITLLSMFTALLATSRALAKNPAQLLQAI